MKNFSTVIVAALRDEMAKFLPKVTVATATRQGSFSIIEGEFNGKGLLIVLTGIGRAAVDAAMTSLFDRYAPALIVSTGYAGAAQPQLSSGALVIANEVKEFSNGTGSVIACDPALVERAQKLSKNGIVGPLVTVREPLVTAHDKGICGAKAGAIAIDMESAAVARGAKKRGIPFLVVRAIFDPLLAELPPPESFLNEARSIAPFRILCYLVTNPQKLLEVPKFLGYRRAAQEAIDQFLELFLKRE